MKDFIAITCGTIVIVLFGAVIGFWVEVYTSQKLPNGFYECKNCGDMSWADLQRYWKNKKGN
jgi:hypothetical protein